VQICRWEFLAFSGTFKTLLNVHEERDAGRVVFSLIKSSFMKDFEGQWQVISNENWLHALHMMPLQTEQHCSQLLTCTMYACMKLRSAVQAVLHAALLLHDCDRFFFSTACMYIWAHTSAFLQINSDWIPQLTIWHDTQANCCVSRCFACL